MEEKITFSINTAMEQQSENLRRMLGTVGSEMKAGQGRFEAKFHAVSKQIATLDKRLTEVEKSTFDGKSMMVKELSDIEARRPNIVLRHF